MSGRRHRVTPPGWPRPRTGDGRLPVPWNAAAGPGCDPGELGQRDARRTRRTSGGWVCQVCGLRLPDDRPAYLCGYIDDTIGAPAGLEPGDRLPEGWGIHAMDHGLMHRWCLRLALRVCPELRRRRADHTLFVGEVPPGSIEAFDQDVLVLDPDSEARAPIRPEAVVPEDVSARR